MEPSYTGPALSGPRAQVYAAVMFVAATLVSLFSPSGFSLTQVALVRLLGPFTMGRAGAFFAYVDPLLQLASLGLSVWVFYEIGKRVDFQHRPMSFAGLVLAGTFVGDAVGYLTYAPSAGQGWETGFGIIVAWGAGDLTSLLTVLTVAFASFMIPMAGLALSSLRQDSQNGSETVGPREGSSYRGFIVSAFVIAALAVPVSGEAYQALGNLTSKAGSIVIESFDPWRSLISGYIGFLVYPVLLVTTFYFLGRGRAMSWREVPKFSLRVFVAGAGGLLAGLVLSVGIQSGWGVVGSFLLSNLPGHVVFLALNGAILLAVGLASASLGMFREGGHGESASVPRGHSFLPILASLLLVLVVAAAAVASYAYVLDPALSVSNASCSYEPGQAFFLRVVADRSQAPVVSQAATAQLVGACPIVTVCTGQPCPMGTQVIRVLGSWNLVTNSTGYFSVPSRMLGGSSLWFSLTYLGHTYQAKYQICGGGVTMGQISLPSGAVSGREVPADNESVISSGIGQNGTQFTSGCGPSTFSGNATVS